MFGDALRAIARDIEHASSLRVFLALPDRLDFENWRQLDQGDLSRELSIDRSSVKRALDDLLRHGVIERQGHRALQVWRLSLNFGWRGNVESYHAARSKRGRSKGQAVEKPRPAVAVAEDVLWKVRPATHIKSGAAGPPR